MHHRPVSIRVITLFCLIFAVVSGHFSYLDVNAHEQIRFMLFAVCALTTGIGIYFVRPWGYFLFLGSSAAFIAQQLLNYISEPQERAYFSLIAAILSSFIVSRFLQKHISAPYFNPKLRWWEVARRVHVSAKAELMVDGQSIEGHILDLSRSGCFMSIPIQFLPGDIIYLKLASDDIHITIMTRVVRKSRQPEGYGLMFLDMSRQERRDLREIIAGLNNKNLEEQSRIEASQEPAA